MWPGNCGENVETPTRLSRTEVAAIVHHVELNQAGWWDKAVQRLFLASVWMEGNLTNSKLRAIFESDFGLKLDAAKIESIADILESQDLLIRHPDGTFRIPIDKRSLFEAEIAEAEESASNAQAYFFSLVEELTDLNPQDTWAKFDSVFLTPLIQETGANAYKFITGEGLEVNEGLVGKFQSQFNTALHSRIVELVTRFLDPSHEAVRSYVSRLLHAVFCVQASGLPDSVIDKLTGEIGKQIQFRIFVDTNFLFSILDLHNNPSNSAATELEELISSLTDVKISFYVTSVTIDEAKRSLLAARSRLTGFPLGAN